MVVLSWLGLLSALPLPLEKHVFFNHYDYPQAPTLVLVEDLIFLGHMPIPIQFSKDVV